LVVIAAIIGVIAFALVLTKKSTEQLTKQTSNSGVKNECMFVGDLSGNLKSCKKKNQICDCPDGYQFCPSNTHSPSFTGLPCCKHTKSGGIDQIIKTGSICKTMEPCKKDSDCGTGYSCVKVCKGENCSNLCVSNQFQPHGGYYPK
jgi:hypothetical protein